MRLTFLMVTAALALAACIPFNSPGATGNNVYVGNYFFTPVIDSATADKDDQLTVTFRWSDSGSGVGHTIVWDSGPAPLPPDAAMQFSGTFEVTVAPGRYYYHCSLHESFGMAGVIIVIPFGTPTASKQQPGPHPFPAPIVVTQPSPEAVQASPRGAVRRSRPATS